MSFIQLKILHVIFTNKTMFIYLQFHTLAGKM